MTILSQQYRVIIKIDFWKSLFERHLTESYGQLIYFQPKTFQYWLESLDFLPNDSSGLPGYLYLSDNCQLTSEIVNQSESSEIILIVVPDWKHFQISYQIYTKESTLSHSDLISTYHRNEVDLQSSYSTLFHVAWNEITLTDGMITPNQTDSVENYQPFGDKVSLNIREYISEESILERTSKTNLELMKIRLAPDLDLETHYQLKVLIIGAGTIGCNIARGLLSWGITSLTFVDNSTVSASNLLRQSLFEKSDLGKSKAEAAAARIRQIYPFSLSRGINLDIPMPGHPETINGLQLKVECLETLIRESDLIFLGTDNRESRWLPSLIANVFQKPLINVAIGFDSWTVMRHPLMSNLPGVRLLKFENQLSSPAVTKEKYGENPLLTANMPGQFTEYLAPPDTFGDVGYSLTSLGRIGIGSLEIGSSYEPVDLESNTELVLEIEQFSCYFCPEVEGVRNTMIDRSLDERCTVTRGGISLIAPGVAVELAVGLLNHPKKFHAKGAKNHTYRCENGLTRSFPPQQIRGNMVDFSTTQYLSRRNPHCVCCSDEISKYYENSTFKIKFLEKVIVDSNLLKSLSGEQQFSMPNLDDIEI